TAFVGRAVVDDLLGRGHEVTLFSRGRTGAELFPGVERRTGDRKTGDYASLAGGSWDAVVDVSAYVPRHVGQAGEALRDRAGRYLFVSTGSVYDRSQASDGLLETTPRLPPERGTEQVGTSTYGPLKVACEDDVLSAWGDAATIVRPGIVAGPHDPTDRFTWWVRRAARGGRVALPARPEQPVQVVDSRDLARLVVRLLEDDRAGTYNAVGPADPVTLAGLVQACARAAGTSVEVVPVDPSAVEPGFPLVLPDPSWDVMFRRSRAAADAAGLPATTLEQTAAEVLAWDRERGEPPLAVELSPEREQELLASP
ncbi:MAG: NAD-dependent epimerase/dehydratase family protein, partial [Frankiales bacterium]|nr:NAD-dependent epimerase/dehydratase family protein [Frankiales bacterium]